MTAALDPGGASRIRLDPESGGMPALPGSMDSRLRGNDGAEIAGTTKVGGTPASRRDAPLPGAPGIAPVREEPIVARPVPGPWPA